MSDDSIETKVLALPDRLRIIPDANGMMYDEYDDVMEAADLIEAQAVEIEELRHDLERQMTIANEYVNEVEELRKPKTVTVTVVSAYDRKAMNTFKINPAEKTYVRPDHSMFGYVFEPEEQSK
jgi:methionine synthase II (cobalamin-independent)